MDVDHSSAAINFLPPFPEHVVQQYRPGARFHPSNVELLGYLRLYNSDPVAFKEEQIFPVFDKTLTQINPSDIHALCQLHASHIACIFLAYREEKNIQYDRKEKKENTNVLCDNDRFTGTVKKIVKVGGPHMQAWQSWSIEELSVHTYNPPLPSMCIFRAIDSRMNSTVKKPSYWMVPPLVNVDENVDFGGGGGGNWLEAGGGGNWLGAGGGGNWLGAGDGGGDTHQNA